MVSKVLVKLEKLNKLVVKTLKNVCFKYPDIGNNLNFPEKY